MSAAFLTPLQLEKVGATRWRLMSPLIYRSVKYPGTFVVPRGFETDLASIPTAIQSLLPKVGNYDAAAVLHDAGYANRLLTASQRRMYTSKPVIDKLFHEACLSLGVGRARAWAMYQAVKLWGDPLGHPSRRGSHDGGTGLYPDSNCHEGIRRSASARVVAGGVRRAHGVGVSRHSSDDVRRDVQPGESLLQQRDRANRGLSALRRRGVPACRRARGVVVAAVKFGSVLRKIGKWLLKKGSEELLKDAAKRAEKK